MGMPAGWLRDRYRVWSGDWIINLEGIIKSLKKIGYDKMASVEILMKKIGKKLRIYSLLVKHLN